MVLVISPITADDVYIVTDWRYAPPYDMYNLEVPTPDEVTFFLSAQNGYHRIVNESGDLVAFCCFGVDAQVAGGDYRQPALDIGLGMRPDLTGRGQGIIFVTAVLAYAKRVMSPELCRVTIAVFNERAQRVWRKAGFDQVQEFHRDFDAVPFVIYTRPA